ncbi:PREDICTED: uncharacterized protein LOC108663047 [Theobroma cacao]|uniref:Uncharacterized protein LOC108663047 n=1 Tax=Theobroma cacao TaxID=3641 RepID=A0AB32WPI1_THECC|nr:PREDICTED: uncharacterized protein LOC108663047 [Theobroma cacao]
MNKAYARLNHQLSVEELFWQQKSGIKWLVEGERNTKFFHMLVKKKRIKSHIFKIQNPDGSWIEEPDAVKSSAMEFVSSLMKKETCDMSRFDTSLIPAIIYENDNLSLCAVPSMEELKEAVFNIDKDSVAGPDGFTSYFYQQSNHLAKVLPSMITDNQSGFVGGRLISDNILIAQELIGKIDRKSRGGNVALKLDMMKAYDQLEWDFLFRMLQQFGFNSQWIGIVRRCIANCWFSLLINGGTVGFFKSERGLRQGDSISPLLFILAAEYLSRGLNALFATYPSLHYLFDCSMPVSHLAFADDIIIFTNGAKSSLQKILLFLQEYEVISGQRINHSKNCFITHRNMANSRTQIISQVTGFIHKCLSITYLGVPLYKGPKKVLKPPICVIERIDRLFNNFLWGGSAGTRKIHWASWHKITLPSNEGGLDIRGLGDVLKAFSMKLWWRNDAKHRDLGMYPNRVVWRAVPHLPKIFSWHKPSAGEFKLNVDGSSKHNRQSAVGGGHLRDHTGTMIFGFSENFGPCDSLQEELMALHRGLLLCIKHNVSRLWIEMDAKVVVHMINKGHQGSSRTRYLLTSIGRSLSSFSFRISHIHREGNQVAEHLANQGHKHRILQVFSQAEG